ncbi:hypothetical protein BT63DRAFT_478104 [Microthyrium microscopicum]|uniref:Uncharacterized protein n=1 Tax=Microthyrium microscopicum TaxID=703497 RepID=A0A6A6UDD8_9PEZI|nr:hypothetical protein BT63DRAFT_478104 [Microthyrium microscopicum]
MIPSFVLAFFLLELFGTCRATCYYPDGTTTDPIGVPCNQVVGVDGPCCRTTFSDACEANGLCYNSVQGYWFRDECTDPTWKSPNCHKICLDGTTGGNSSSSAKLTSCPTDGSFCCGAIDPTVCCSSSSRIFLSANSSSTSSSTSQSPTSSSTSTSSTSQPRLE